MLTATESAALDALRTARDELAKGGRETGPAIAAVEQSIREVYAVGGERDQQNVEQADYLAEQVVLLTGAVESAEGATATAKVLVDGSTTVTVKVPARPEPLADVLADEPVAEGPAAP